ncbi:hypothetical protein AB0940_33465 [Streptomyces sp. NPDC006656]
MSTTAYAIGLLLASGSVVLAIAGVLLLVACWPRAVRLPRHDRHAR